MDKQTMQGWLSDLRGELAKIDRHREVLLTMLRAGEEWLSINAIGGRQLGLPAPQESSGRTAAVLDRKMHLKREVLVSVLHDAAGTTLHVVEIGERAKALGYWSRAKNLPATSR